MWQSSGKQKKIHAVKAARWGPRLPTNHLQKHLTKKQTRKRHSFLHAGQKRTCTTQIASNISGNVHASRKDRIHRRSLYFRGMKGKLTKTATRTHATKGMAIANGMDTCTQSTTRRANTLFCSLFFVEVACKRAQRLLCHLLGNRKHRCDDLLGTVKTMHTYRYIQ